MSKRVTLTDDELFILRKFVLGQLQTTLISSYWVFQTTTHRDMKRLLKKLEDTEEPSNV